MSETIAILGLGYVGLPVALAFARAFPGTVGFDVHVEKVKELASGFDRNREVSKEVLTSTPLVVTSDLAGIAKATFYVVAVPTPVDENNVPDLTPVVRASESVGKVLKRGDVVASPRTYAAPCSRASRPRALLLG
jgi:UDP-N-acetyl-D-galactosamine dehydrogenase